MTAGTVVYGPDGERVVLAEVGQTLLLENDRVRIWEVALAPGETQPPHLHHNPYLVVSVEVAPGRMDWLDRSPPRFTSEVPGGVLMRPPSPVHRLTNIGDHPYRNRLVELKDRGEDATGEVAVPPPRGPAEGDTVTGPGGTPVRLGPPGHAVLLEDDGVRVWDVTLDPGETLAWHAHRNPAAVVVVEPSRLRVETLGAPATTDTATVGFRDAGETRQLTNLGTTRYRSRLVELTFRGEDLLGGGP